MLIASKEMSVYSYFAYITAGIVLILDAVQWYCHFRTIRLRAYWWHGRRPCGMSCTRPQFWLCRLIFRGPYFCRLRRLKDRIYTHKNRFDPNRVSYEFKIGAEKKKFSPPLNSLLEFIPNRF